MLRVSLKLPFDLMMTRTAACARQSANWQAWGYCVGPLEPAPGPKQLPQAGATTQCASRLTGAGVSWGKLRGQFSPRGTPTIWLYFRLPQYVSRA